MTKMSPRAKRLWNLYGITLDTYSTLLKKQKNVCDICKKLPKSGVLCVDHRHVKNYKKLKPEDKFKEVRGLLCFMCNVMIGKLERRKIARQLLKNTVKYFDEYKIFGDI